MMIFTELFLEEVILLALSDLNSYLLRKSVIPYMKEDNQYHQLDE